MPTSTVEDYLKRIYIEQRRAAKGRVSTGRLATELDVAPGTVTAMMKTLAESKLVEYEPYAGVRLTATGREAATRVLRRHRVVELFLVRVMGVDWTEVHPEAEILEHAVSESLIDRMDEMMGHPTVDPHGDPIPTSAGNVDEGDDPNLVDCPTGTRIRVTRIMDQRPEFLQLLERSRMRPGDAVEVESRDSAAQTVLVHPELGEPLRLAFQAASVIFVKPV